jgi:uncharacterized protein YbjT (DUF2867 family)
MQPLWVEDYARCLAAVTDRPELANRTLLLAGGERFSYRQIVQQVLLVVGIKRIPLPVPLLLARMLSWVMMRWWYWPAVSRYFLDRLVVPEVAEVDAVRRHFGFYPARMGEAITYLNRPGLRWRLFRR